jgi:hypothetical protein
VTLSAPCLLDRGIGKQSIEPGVEPVGIAQPRQVPPGSNERLLDRVARQLTVSEDQTGGRVQARGGGPNERAEGFAIAFSCALHEHPLVHDRPSFGAAPWAALESYGGGFG